MTKNNKTKICFISGSRADYGIASNLLKKINKSKNINLSLIASCMHLSKNYGNTFKEIENDGLKITKKIYLPLNTNKKKNLSKSAGVALIKFSKVLTKLNPDFVLLVGDRYETFVAAFATLILNIPIAHLHGGELTLSSIDDAMRHSITKMSAIHFVSNQIYKKRVIQLGENPKNVHVVGSLGVENTIKMPKLKKKEIEKKINLKFNKNNFLVTIHPETINGKDLEKILPTLIKYLEKLKNTGIVFTSPNSDPGNLAIKKIIKKFCKQNSKKFKYVKSMGQKLYFSYLRYCNVVIGNSSSGIIEAPSLGIPTINIGLRQKGRIQSSSVINTSYSIKLFKKAIAKIYSKKFQKKIKKNKNPYFQKNTSEKILKILKKRKIMKSKDLNKKMFYDIKKYGKYFS